MPAREGTGLVAGVEQDERAGAVGALRRAAPKQAWPNSAPCWSPTSPATGMPSGRNPTPRVRPTTPELGTTRGSAAAGTRSSAVSSSLPPQVVQVEQERARGVGRIRHVFAGEAPREPGVDGAETELAALGAGAGAGHVVEQPLGLRPGEVGVEHEARAVPEQRLVAGLPQLAAPGRRPPVLPHERAVDGLAGGAVPEQGGLALVGDADGGEAGRVHLGGGERTGDGLGHRLPDLGDVVLDLPGVGVVVGEVDGDLGEDAQVLGDQQRGGAGRSLVDGEDDVGHAGLRDEVLRHRRRACQSSGGLPRRGGS
jgi:hypothetical protein